MSIYVRKATGAAMAKAIKDVDRMSRQVQVMTGERNSANKQSTVLRRGELLPLASLASSMKSKQITAAPTMADYNALQADVAAIYSTILQLSNLLGTAKIPKPTR